MENILDVVGHAYFTGDFHRCIQLVKNFEAPNEKVKEELLAYQLMSWIAVKKPSVHLLEQYQHNSSLLLETVHRFANLKMFPQENRADSFKWWKNYVDRDDNTEQHALFHFIGFSTFMDCNNEDYALRLLYRSGDLFSKLTAIDVLLRLNRIDEAESVVTSMDEINPEDWMTLLGRAAVAVNKKQFEEAYTVCGRILSKNRKNPLAIINMLKICRRLGKEEDRRTYIEKMKVAHSDHPWTCEYLRIEQLKMVQTAAVAEKGRGLWSTQRGQMLSLSLPSLADMRNSYYLGNYQKCINLARHVSCPSDMEAKDLWIALAAIASGSPSFPLDRFKEIKKTSYVAVCRFARFQNPAERPDILMSLEDELCHGKFKADEVNCITGALMMASVGNVDDGLIMLYKCASIHTRAVAVELLLKIDRLDSAKEEVELMMQIDESSILTQLARASVNLAISRRKLSDSLDIYTSLTEQHGRSTLLLTEQGEIFLLQGKFEEAELVLQKAYEIDSGNPKVLVPLIRVTDRLGHHKMRNIYVETMKEKHPNHPSTMCGRRGWATERPWETDSKPGKLWISRKLILPVS